MKACGIVAEYNPLHTGHVYQMNKARQISQADCIIRCYERQFCAAW